jgi:hypothetical protein
MKMADWHGDDYYKSVGGAQDNLRIDSFGLHLVFILCSILSSLFQASFHIHL